MTIVGYPTEDFPGPLPFALDLPAGWEAIHVAGSLLAARKAGGEATFRPNVVVSWQRAPANADVATIAARVLAGVRHQGVAPRQTIEAATIATDVHAALVTYGGEPDDDDELRHVGLLLVGPPSGRSRDLYEAVGTHRRSDEDGRRDVRNCLLSFSLATPSVADAVPV